MKNRSRPEDSSKVRIPWNTDTPVYLRPVLLLINQRKEKSGCCGCAKFGKIYTAIPRMNGKLSYLCSVARQWAALHIVR